jgi:hypothetical protein
MKKYILQGRVAVHEPDVLKWAAWLEHANTKVVVTTLEVKHMGLPISHVTISTVFLGLDHSFTSTDVHLFETMVFGGGFDGIMDRCDTWDNAVTMHETILENITEHLQQEGREYDNFTTN